MNAYSKEQIRQAMIDLFERDNAVGAKPRKRPTAQQHIAIGMVMIALGDYDKKLSTQPTPTPQ